MLRHIDLEYQTDLVVITALNNVPFALKYVINQKEEYCHYAIDREWSTFEYVREKTLELCKYALKKDKRSIRFIPDEMLPIEY